MHSSNQCPTLRDNVMTLDQQVHNLELRVRKLEALNKKAISNTSAKTEVNWDLPLAIELRNSEDVFNMINKSLTITSNDMKSLLLHVLKDVVVEDEGRVLIGDKMFANADVSLRIHNAIQILCDLVNLRVIKATSTPQK